MSQTQGIDTPSGLPLYSRCNYLNLHTKSKTVQSKSYTPYMKKGAHVAPLYFQLNFSASCKMACALLGEKHRAAASAAFNHAKPTCSLSERQGMKSAGTHTINQCSVL